MIQACYRELHRYKYQLVEPYQHAVGISARVIRTPFLSLDAEGLLGIAHGYAWDGPSGPTIDTLNFMRGALVHDALYQLMRMEKIPFSYRDHADQLLRAICLEDGMSKFRAWYVYQAVKLFGGANATPGSGQPDEIICVPSEAEE